MKYSLLIPILFLLSSICCFAQENAESVANNDTSATEKKKYLAIYPIVFSFPETRFGFGAAGISNFFPGKKKSKQPSQLQFGAAYTLNKQLLTFTFFQFNLNEDKTRIFGELGYYDYVFPYFGIGNNTFFENQETYAARFPRLRLNYLQKVDAIAYFGLHYKFDDYNIFEQQENGLLQLGNNTIGRNGSVVSIFGPIFQLDNRDNIFYPSSGHFLQIEFGLSSTAFLATENFNQFLFDYKNYFSYKKLTLASNLIFANTSGDAPFQQLHTLGGGRRARGIIEGRYRANHLAVLQQEIRFPIFWRILGNAFYSIGDVADNWKVNENSWKFNYGAGLRFLLDKKNKTNVRFDLAFGSNEPQFYLTVGEAF